MAWQVVAKLPNVNSKKKIRSVIHEFLHTYGQTGEESDVNSCYEGRRPHLKTDAWTTANVAPTPTQNK